MIMVGVISRARLKGIPISAMSDITQMKVGQSGVHEIHANKRPAMSSLAHSSFIVLSQTP
jgi:hypothetical protein